jgi:cell division protein FtsN
MAKDYAKATFKSTRARRIQRSRSRLLLLIFVCVMTVSTVLSWYLYQNKAVIFNKDNIVTWTKELKTLLHRQKPQVTVNQIAKTGGVDVAPQEPEVRFDFYTELPNMQVKLPVVETEANKNVPPPVNISDNQTKITAGVEVGHQPLEANAVSENSSSPKDQSGTTIVNHSPSADKTTVASPQYVVQVGSFKSDSAASEMRISILLAGFDVSVVKIKVDDQIIYRIQEGPYNSQARAKSAQKKLQAKGFDAVVRSL